MTTRSLLPARPLLALAGLAALGLGGCATLQQFAALRHVDFALDRASNVRIAGVAVERFRSWNDLTAADAARLTLAAATGEVPLEMDLYVAATNPAENDVTAQLMELDWTLLLENRETISGRLDRAFALPPGQRVDIPVGIRLDLVEFFGDNARDLFELALAISGEGGAPKNVALRASPTVDTPIGPIRYPQPITILSRDVGTR